LVGHDAAVNAFAFTPEGEYIATASADCTVRLWRTQDGTCVGIFTEHEAAVTHLVISDDGSVLASGAENGTVCVRKMEEILPGRNGTILLCGHNARVNALTCTPRGEYVATATADCTVRLWGTEDGACVATFTEHEAAVTHVVISDDGSVLASGAEGRCVR
ncbi:WD40-repeat-containing domain protein, partial [Daedaleopsis nitida]